MYLKNTDDWMLKVVLLQDQENRIKSIKSQDSKFLNELSEIDDNITIPNTTLSIKLANLVS